VFFNSNVMKILIIPSENFITESEPLGGIFQLHQAKVLNKAGFLVGVLSVGFISTRYLFKKYDYKKTQCINGINIIRDYTKLFFPYRYLPFFFKKYRLTKRADVLFNNYVLQYGKPDIIHAHNFLYAGVIADYLKKRHGINFIITEHSSSFSRNKISKNSIKSIQIVSKNASAVTAVSKSFIKLLKSFIKSDIDILPNLVDNIFFEGEFKNKLDSNFTFLHVGSLDLNKNQELIIKSFKKLSEIYNNVHLKIAGEGVLLIHLENLVRVLQLDKKVTFLHRITQQKVKDEMMEADCFILSSNFETFGVVLIEALACGLPLISTKCGGPDDIININNGLLIDVGNQFEMEQAILFMYENINKYSKEKLRIEARERYSEEAFMKNVVKYYKQGINYAN
jgi:glycosyltransferase involved in cell wall biosynthesis